MEVIQQKTKNSFALAVFIATSTGVAWGQTPESGVGLSDEFSLGPAIQATRLDYSRFEIPASVTVLTQEDIRRQGFIEVSEIFRAVPGFRIVKIGDESRISYHGTTAGQNRRLKVTINGRNTLVGDGAYVEFDRLPIDLEDIARVTITRGPNGSTFGDNAYMASVNFETFGSNDPDSVSVRVGGGDQDRHKYGVAINRQMGDFHIQLTAGREEDGGYEFHDAAKTITRNDGKEISRLYLGIEHNGGPSRWLFEASGYDSEHGLDDPILSLLGEQMNDGSFLALSNYRDLGENRRLDWSVSYNDSEELFRLGGCYTPESIARTSMFITDPVELAILLFPSTFVPQLIGAPLEDTCFFNDANIKSDRTDAEVEFEQQSGNLRYVVGASATQVNAESAQRLGGIDRTQRSYRLFGEAAYSMDRVSISLGVMAQDSNNVSDTEYAVRGGINWHLSPSQTVRYSYARGFRIPPLVETDAVWTSAVNFHRRQDPPDAFTFSIPFPVLVNPNIVEPEMITSNEIGYFVSLNDSRAYIDIKAFHERISNPVETYRFFYSDPQPSNQPGFTLTGAEVEASVRVTEALRVSGQYSSLDNNSNRVTERSLHGDSAGSVSASYQITDGHALTAAYYGNSTISGNSYDRYDLVYNMNKQIGSANLRLQFVYQHHIGGVDGIAGTGLFSTDEAVFADVDQLFIYGEVRF